MKKLFFSLLSLFLSYQASFADAGIFGSFKGTSAESEKALKNGNIHIDDIPVILRNAIDFLMEIAGTISIIFIIVGAYQILIGGIEQDKTKGIKTIKMALMGFAISGLSWFIIKLIIDNIS